MFQGERMWSLCQMQSKDWVKWRPNFKYLYLYIHIHACIYIHTCIYISPSTSAPRGLSTFISTGGFKSYLHHCNHLLTTIFSFMIMLPSIHCFVLYKEAEMSFLKLNINPCLTFSICLIQMLCFITLLNTLLWLLYSLSCPNAPPEHECDGKSHVYGNPCRKRKSKWQTQPWTLKQGSITHSHGDPHCLWPNAGQGKQLWRIQ